MALNISNTNSSSIPDIFQGNAGAAQTSGGITTKAFVLNLATGVGLFVFQLSGFFLLKSSNLGRRLYQPKTYLVPERLRVEAIPVNPLKWLHRIFTIKGEELKLKCGLDGYFAIRFLRAMCVIFFPVMLLCVVTLLPVNYHGGKDQHDFIVGDHTQNYNVTGLDSLSWQNVAPTKTNRYWAHLVCALVTITWTLYRIYREKRHFISVRQAYLTSPEQRLKASAKTILVTNIPSEYRSAGALKALFDVFVDNDDRSRIHVWVNRDYGALRKLVMRRRKLCHALEKEEVKLLRLVNKKLRKDGEVVAKIEPSQQQPEGESVAIGGDEQVAVSPSDLIRDAFEADNTQRDQLWPKSLPSSQQTHIKIAKDGDGHYQPVSSLKFWHRQHDRVLKTAWLRSELARLTMEIEALLPELDSEAKFPRQNSAFIQFDRQMAANMACALISHHAPGKMSPRYLHVAPHEILWPNMGLTTLARFIRVCIALVLFVGILILWAIPAFFLGILSQLESLRNNTKWLAWLKDWPSWIISLISGPLTAILLALLVQLVVPALCRKLAVLCGVPTRSRREVVTQGFYFTFLIIELVLVTSISSGLLAVIPVIANNPTLITQTLATNLPKAANYFFNYLIIQALGFSGSALFQYLRILFITLIWPWFSQTPRQEAWLQITIPHQMWANVFSLWTNFAVIGLIYSIIAPLMLVFVSAVFGLFFIVYRHNYYFVQRNKVDTFGALFEGALSQLFAGVYILEITLIGLFFLVRNTNDNVVATPQAIIMIIALAFTAAYHYILEHALCPLYELLPVTLEDKAADAEKELLMPTSRPGSRGEETYELQDSSPTTAEPEPGSPESRVRLRPRSTEKPEVAGGFNDNEKPSPRGLANVAADARKTMNSLHHRIEMRLAAAERQSSNLPHWRPGSGRRSRKIEVADQLGEAIAGFPDELLDLSPSEREAELRAAYQDPVTREPQPVVWIPQDTAGLSEHMVRSSEKYGRWLQYSTAGAYLTEKGKCEVTQPAPDVRSDWLLDWVL
ncbi:hypothetical protein LTR56_001006 [Elasticomyces elasticus]|nr:hypothetical protein LTR22_013222 [Elasticomyces elasticus]KAK3660080.1 hypothetical protein LTR56_001006 [Elasticomyces elasticus]KAK4911081.1 hypothetical protein LTR49_020344 [Elasticomyces elasticus]KAK5750513.1 hypothetical protein LTS12_019389 [Elasticomyces elasticus]